MNAHRLELVEIFNIEFIQSVCAFRLAWLYFPLNSTKKNAETEQEKKTTQTNWFEEGFRGSIGWRNKQEIKQQGQERLRFAL